MQGVPAALPLGIPGMGLLMLISVQQTPQARHSISISTPITIMYNIESGFLSIF
jgi:hypothetical protein